MRAPISGLRPLLALLALAGCYAPAFAAERKPNFVFVYSDDHRWDHEFSYWNRDVAIPVERLKAGRNVIAVRVENTAGSSDLYVDLTVIVETPSAPKK